MPQAVADVETLQVYIQGVMARAAHHANDVEEVCLAVVGGIIWKKDPGSVLEVMEQEGDLKNVLWVRIGGQRYAFTYNHGTRAIDVKRGTTRGPLLRSFTGASTLHDVKTEFENF